jgi:S-adenosylmethionine synthetase
VARGNPSSQLRKAETMIEKVNPQHPDKIADRIAGAIVDYAYTQQEDPKIAVEILTGHGEAHIIAETSVGIPKQVIREIVKRISGIEKVTYKQVGQDPHLAANQSGMIRAGDNGIFMGVPVNKEVRKLSVIVRRLYETYPTDGKFILAGNRLIVCQSNATRDELEEALSTSGLTLVINPLGDWSGGLEVDTGAVNRKLGSDMGEAVTGGGLHGKDLSKADVAVNIYAHLKAQQTGETVSLHCAIGDEEVGGIPYKEIIGVAKSYIDEIGGFEKLAEWGLINYGSEPTPERIAEIQSSAEMNTVSRKIDINPAIHSPEINIINVVHYED